MASAPHPDQELDRIRAAIADARQKLGREANLDLAPLAGALGILCEQIAALPMETARGYAAALHSTLQLLQALEDDIRRAHDELQQRLQALGGSETAGGEGID